VNLRSVGKPLLPKRISPNGLYLVSLPGTGMPPRSVANDALPK
jgi:hypothetical protein